MSRQELINAKNIEIQNLKNEIRDICFEHIKEEKDIVLGDMIHIPSKNKFAIFCDLHTEEIENSVIKSFVLTRLGVPSKKVTTFNINDTVKTKESIEDIITKNFSGEDFNAEIATNACIEIQTTLSK